MRIVGGSVELTNMGKAPYKLDIVTTTGFVAVRLHPSGAISIRRCNGEPVEVLKARRISLWSCQAGQKDRELEEPQGGLLSLNCSRCKLTEFMSLSSTLHELDCSFNQIEELYLTGGGRMRNAALSLEKLICNDNKIKRFDFSTSKRLRIINCANNRIENLRLGMGFTELESLDCSNNCLSVIDLAGLVALQCLNATQNRIGLKQI